MPETTTADERRRALIRTLLDERGLARVAERACHDAGIPERTAQLEYCLAVLAHKKDAAPDFTDRLTEQAATVAGHLRRWAGTYDAIQQEFERREIATLRRYVQTWPGDDVIDTVSDQLAAILAAGPRAEEMTLERLAEDEPARNEYVFQSPLEAWIKLSARRRFPPETSVLTDTGPTPREEPASLAEAIDRADATNEEVLRLLVVAVSERFEARALLAELIERADRFEVEVARMRPASPTHRTLLGRLRAAIADIADRLRQERRAFQNMLAYVVLAMRGAVKLQGVAILSLRSSSIEREAVEVIRRAMHALLTDDRQPTPLLLANTRAAADARRIAAGRASALERLPRDGAARADALGGVAQLLDVLPDTVEGGAAAIAAAVPWDSTARTVTVNRSEAGRELHAVDPWYGQVFRRYAIGAA